jgi:leucyl-tRNA synthetase
MIHKTIKGVTKDMEQLGFNTAVSKMMIFVNHVYDVKVLSKSDFEAFLKLLAPFATKLAQQLRGKLCNTTNIHLEAWPVYDEAMIAEEAFDLPVQINGKMRGTLNVKMGLEQDEILKLIQESGNRTQYLEGKEFKKVIYVKDKIVNLIVL